tara:strand:- start:575 stop:742 length:168 start_codon:yes stop_codon:yes gene_type:complete
LEVSRIATTVPIALPVVHSTRLRLLLLVVVASSRQTMMLRTTIQTTIHLLLFLVR